MVSHWRSQDRYDRRPTATPVVACGRSCYRLPRSGLVQASLLRQPVELIAHGETAAYVRDQMGHSSIKVTFDTYGHLFPGRGKEASARYEKSMADAKVRHKAEAGVSNPLAIDREEGPEGTVTN
jgi:integrase